MFPRSLIRATVAAVRLSRAVTTITTKLNSGCANRSAVMAINTAGIQRLYSAQSSTELTVDYDYVKNATSDNNILIVDVREPDEIKTHGKIPNSINIPLGNVSSVLNTMSGKDFEVTYNRPKPSKDTQIIFYCMIGKRSGLAQQNAIELGFKNSKNYVGSWTEWALKTQ